MVEKTLLENLQTICHELEKSRGSLNLFAILKMDELMDKWTVVVASPWVNDVGYETIFKELRELLIENLTHESMSTFARIAIFTPQDHLAKLMIEKFSDGDSIKEDQQINGNLVHEGYILKVVR